MLQQTALMLVAGLMFLFFFTPDYQETTDISPILTALLVIAFTFIPGLISYILGRRAINRLTDDYEKQIRQLQNSSRYAFFFGLVVLAGFVFEIYYLRLPIIVDKLFAFWKFENSRLIICMIPLIIGIMLNRLAVFELDRKVRNTSWTRRKFIALNLKIVIFSILPFIIYLLISDLIDHSPLKLRLFFISHSYLYWVLMIAIIAVMYIKAPLFLRLIWSAQSLPDGKLRDRIRAMADRDNIKYRDVLVWNTEGGNVSNAAMAGLLTNSRYVFLTDSLLDNFTTDEIETIVAHEFGHIKYNHAFAYLVFSAGYLVFYTILYILFLPLIDEPGINPTLAALLGALITLGVFYSYFIFVFRYLSRKFERQADLYAINLTGKPESFKNALIRLSAVNYIPDRIHRLAEVIRTHPSVHRRLEFISKAISGDPEALKYTKPIISIGKAAVLVLIAFIVIFITNRDAIISPADVYYEIGRQYAIEGMVDEAIKEFRKAVSEDPKSDDAHFALGLLYAKKGVMEEAIKEMEKAMEINPRNEFIREKLKQIKDVRSKSMSQ